MIMFGVRVKRVPLASWQDEHWSEVTNSAGPPTA